MFNVNQSTQNLSLYLSVSPNWMPRVAFKVGSSPRIYVIHTRCIGSRVFTYSTSDATTFGSSCIPPWMSRPFDDGSRSQVWDRDRMSRSRLQVGDRDSLSCHVSRRIAISHWFNCHLALSHVVAIPLTGSWVRYCEPPVPARVRQSEPFRLN